MFVQVTLLSEVPGAVADRTSKWLLILVNSQMVEEIVPFAELLLAAVDVADEHLGPTTCLRAEVLHKPKLAGFWHN